MPAVERGVTPLPMQTRETDSEGDKVGGGRVQLSRGGCDVVCPASRGEKDDKGKEKGAGGGMHSLPSMYTYMRGWT